MGHSWTLFRYSLFIWSHFYTEKTIKGVAANLSGAFLWPWVRIPSTNPTLFQFVADLWYEKDENKQKRPGLDHI